ncbi:MAG TPA: hypothetical protein PKX92_11310 [Edaphocola sp.]|nr:hypothetical protein [Edaphocola sp.]
MKRIALILFIGLLGSGTFVLAQQKSNSKHRITRTEARQNAEARAKATTERLTRELNLSPDQKSKINALVLNNYKKSNNTVADQQKLNEDINQILSPQQRQLKKETSTLKVQEIQKDNHKRVASPVKE